jgi:serine/threonine protein phosphatase PrpC
MQPVKNINVSSQEVKAGALVKLEMITKQLCSRQDHTALGSYNNSDGAEVYWGAVFDGHGGNTCIETIRQADLDEIMKNERPHILLQNLIDVECQKLRLHDRYESGATFIFVKVTITDLCTEIKITNIGDSRAILCVNGEPVFISEAHDYDNGKEMVRLIKENRVDTKFPIINKGYNFDVISPTTVVSKTGKYVNFVTPTSDRSHLSMTQCLGHMGICGFAPDTTTYKLNPTDTFKVFLMSDGVTDVIPVDGFACAPSVAFFQNAKSAETVALEAELRWKQVWMHHGSRDLRRGSNTKFPGDGYDDCCCMMLERRPITVTLVDPLSANP